MPLTGQTTVGQDTIFIKEVRIRGERIRDHLIRPAGTSFDTTILEKHSLDPLAVLIAGNFPAYIKTYGSGGLATPSLRGTTAGHTGVEWNNINISNPMTGQSDLSLFPTGLADDIRIMPGAQSMNITSGSPGGLISLNSRPEWDGRTALSLNSSAGSFGRRSVLIKARTGTNAFQSATKVYLHEAENNFPYINHVSGNEPVKEKRENNQVRQQGLIQEMYYRSGGSALSARFWYQKAKRLIPVPIITPTMNPPERQEDESFRSMLDFNLEAGKSEINLTSAFVSDKLNYVNEKAGINSRNVVNRIILKGRAERDIDNLMKLEFSAANELGIVATNNYDSRKYRNVLTMDASASLSILNWLSTKLLVREIVEDNKIHVPDLAAFADLRPFSTREYYLKIAFSRNSRIPTFNDLFWMPGGNKDLVNETGYSAEIKLDIKETISGSAVINSSVTLYHNRVKNLIQWRPGSNSYWQAINIEELAANGFEAGLDLNIRKTAYNLRLISSYSHIISGTGERGSFSTRRAQLMYVPVNMFNASCRAERGNIYYSARLTYTGKRYTDADNTQYLPSDMVTDMDAGYRLASGKIVSDIRFTVENVFNADYQNIAFYPMPGRSYFLSLILQFKK